MLICPSHHYGNVALRRPTFPVKHLGNSRRNASDDVANHRSARWGGLVRIRKLLVTFVRRRGLPEAVPGGGVEPPRPEGPAGLSRLRLPFRHPGSRRG